MTARTHWCGLCGIADPYPLAAGYQAPRAVAEGLPAHHHQCCVIHVLIGGLLRCPACTAARAAETARHRRTTRPGQLAPQPRIDS